MTAAGLAEPWRELADAYAHPWRVAERWRAGGGRVVGLFGRYAPAEIVRASGALPIRLDPARLGRPAALGDGPTAVPDGLAGELSAGSLAVVSSLLEGELDWIDGLLIGRDSEMHTKLFYVIREMAGDPEFRTRIPPFAFCDVLRLPVRTSAVYNRVRLRQLHQTVAGWWGGEPSTPSLRQAIAAEAGTRSLLRELDRLRAERRLTARQLLLAAGAAQVLPGPESAAVLQAAISAAEQAPPRSLAPRLFVTGSEPTPEIYEVIEAAGLSVVGDDAGWAHDTLPEADDPIAALADTYQFSSIGSARAGLERASTVSSMVRRARAEAVLQLVLPGDEASEWELAELRSLLAPTPVVSIGFDPAIGYEPLQEAAADLFSRRDEGRLVARLVDGADRD